LLFFFFFFQKRPPSDSSEEPTAVEATWKSVKDCGVAFDRNARFRRTMEDAHVTIDELCGPGTAYFAVYDGHGGRGAVNFVQEHLHVNFREQIELGLDVAEAFKTSFLKTDADMAAGDVGYSGSTVAAAFIQTVGDKRILHTANCGDARIVLCRNGQAQRMTVDHKGSDPVEVKRIQDAGGLVVLNRVSGILAVTRSLGDLKMKEYVIGDPYCEKVELLDSDLFLVVACDGLWDVASDQDVCETLTAPSDDSSAQALANKLLVKALKAGSTDNISIVVIKLK
jgi:serine/threonine protein phosphatase PrpC